jgi:NAD(P)-dependent dehydrogenase (short-subunit alcohol dehydrogenase family)
VGRDDGTTLLTGSPCGVIWPRHALRQSKLANVIFTVELHRRLAAQNSRVTTNAVHPGNVQTEVRPQPVL